MSQSKFKLKIGRIKKEFKDVYGKFCIGNLTYLISIINQIKNSRKKLLNIWF